MYLKNGKVHSFNTHYNNNKPVFKMFVLKEAINIVIRLDIKLKYIVTL